MSEAVKNDQVLRLENITMQFGGVVAINNLSLKVNPGEIVALIGPNGAGKTTAFNCITGVYESCRSRTCWGMRNSGCPTRTTRPNTPPTARRTAT